MAIKASRQTICIANSEDVIAKCTNQVIACSRVDEVHSVRLSGPRYEKK